MSRKRHPSFRRVWSRYYQFLVEGQIFYLKLSAYTNRSDGMKEWEMITEQTYKNAMKRGYGDNVVIVEEEVAFTELEPLTLIFNEVYQLEEDSMRYAVYEARESVRELRKHTKIPEGLEYKIFKSIMELKVKGIKEKQKEAM